MRTLLAVGATANFIDAVVRPPGFSPNPDPYVRGNEEGARPCDWTLSATNTAYSGRTPPGRLTSASDVPGHFCVFVKLNGEVQYWDRRRAARARAGPQVAQ